MVDKMAKRYIIFRLNLKTKDTAYTVALSFYINVYNQR